MKLKNKFRNWLKSIEKKETEDGLYWFGIIGGIFVVIIYVAVYVFSEIVGFESIKNCKLKELLGIPCPGCGGTRAIVLLFKGKVISSIYYNAFATYSVLIYLIFMISHTLQRITGGKIKGIKFYSWYIKVAQIILVVQYIIKLIIPGYVV